MRSFLLWTSIAVLMAASLIGFIHTPLGLSIAGDWCPIGTDEANAVDREARRTAATARLAAGGVAAGARPSAGFELGVATRADVLAAAATTGLRCGPGRDRIGLSCSDPRGVAPHLAADFGADGTLVALSRMRSFPDAGAAESALEREVGALVAAVGQPSRRKRAGAGGLARAPLRQERVEFSRRDYFASLSATNLGTRFVVSEVFRAP